MKALPWIVCVLLLIGCRSVEYVPYAVPSVQTEYRDRLVRDSVVLHDSIHVKERGDTVWMERWHTAYCDRTVRDTVVRTDSIPAPYPVERELGRWEQMKVGYGGGAIGVVAVMVFAVFGWIVYKLKK